ncbi:MAG: 50S ribosomal protein L13 [Coxiellaceae bacterium]|nr:50S ribosomal protein L13 [Coxiellaceae bacterium]
MKTYMANSQSTTEKWYVVDAEDKTLGRLASVVASRLRGKHKAEYTPHAITGDHIIIVNAEKVKVTGNKTTDKIYYSHSGYPGGIKNISFDKLQQKAPTMIIEKAIKGMLPKGPLGRDMFRNLKVYAGTDHPHQAQQPESLEVI